jgi:HEAT repeat protein
MTMTAWFPSKERRVALKVWSIILSTGVPLLTGLVAAGLAAPAGDTVQTMLDARALQGAYNPVLLSFLVEEGRSKLTEAQRKAAIEQLVAAFKGQAKITPGAQVAASMATLAGLLTKGAVSQGLTEGAAEVWSSWVDAAFVLQKAGYKEESAAFFASCLQTFPYDTLRARCASGLAAADPDQALTVLVGLLDTKKYPEEVNQTALAMLGDLAATPGLPQPKKDAAIEELTKRTQGFMNKTLNAAAVEGLIRSHDPRAVETIRKFTKGMLAEQELKRRALRGLLLTYNDAGALESLQKELKGGFMKEPKERIWAVLILIEGGQQTGYDWALQYVTGKKKGDVDFSDELIQAMINKGGDPARDTLSKILASGKTGEWLSAWIAIGLLDMGDESHAELVRAALANKNWPYTRLRAAVALARHKDYSGLPVLKVLSEPQATGFWKSAAESVFRGSDKPDPDGMRSSVARALGSIDTPAVVPILLSLLDDRSERVRLSAAYALVGMKDAAALDGLTHALDVDYGKEEGRARAPEVKATIVRTSALRFEQDARTRTLLKKAGDSDIVSVKFLALAAAGKTPIRKPSPRP